MYRAGGSPADRWLLVGRWERQRRQLLLSLPVLGHVRPVRWSHDLLRLQSHDHLQIGVGRDSPVLPSFLYGQSKSTSHDPYFCRKDFRKERITLTCHTLGLSVWTISRRSRRVVTLSLSFFIVIIRGAREFQKLHERSTTRSCLQRICFLFRHETLPFFIFYIISFFQQRFTDVRGRSWMAIVVRPCHKWDRTFVYY